MFEARENFKEAVAMVLQANRELAEESSRGAEVLRELRHRFYSLPELFAPSLAAFEEFRDRLVSLIGIRVGSP
jgi:hypothetical protein